MSKRAKQVSLFFDAAHSTSSEVIDFHQLWDPSVFIPLPPWGTGWRGPRMPPLVLIKVNWFRSLLSRFTVETVHICKCFSEVCSEFHQCISAWFVQWDFPIFLVSVELLRGWAIGVGFPVLILSISMHFSSIQPTLSCESRYVNTFRKRSSIPSNFFSRHLLRALWATKCSFCASVFAVPSTTRSPLSDDVVRDWEHSVAIDENVGWIRFQPRDVHKCNRSLLDSNKEGILSIANLELFRINRTILHCSFHESLLSNPHWMGCRFYFAANQLEVHPDEDDSRSSSRVREHGSFLLVSQLHVAIQTLWRQCLFPRATWTNRLIVHFQQVSPFLFDLRLRFRLRLCLSLNVQLTLAHNC